MGKIQTAEEYLKKLDEESGTIWTEDDESICNALKEFAKLHVEAALKAAAENVKVEIQITDGLFETKVKKIINKDSILNAYSLSNIQ